jgi:hypothetical protein
VLATTSSLTHCPLTLVPAFSHRSAAAVNPRRSIGKSTLPVTASAVDFCSPRHKSIHITHTRPKLQRPLPLLRTLAMQELLLFTPAYCVVGVYRLFTDRNIRSPVWAKLQHGAQRGYGFLLSYAMHHCSARLPHNMQGRSRRDLGKFAPSTSISLPYKQLSRLLARLVSRGPSSNCSLWGTFNYNLQWSLSLIAL